ncbi:MAG: hypothetical protein J0L84_07930 [Verrucomicrobia bacterium]|nr:hypothetical protein [Verrucomicrobiota bacterium]
MSHCTGKWLEWLQSEEKHQPIRTHMKKTILTSFVAFATLAAPISTHAQLVMTIDTTAKTYTLSGSDSGFTDFAGLISWAVVGPVTDVSQTISVNSTGYSLNPGPAVAGSLNFGYDILMVDPGSVTLTFFSSPGAQIFSGLGTPTSYAGASAINQAVLESLIGQTMPLVVGSGFQGVSIVPEPHEYAAMAGLGLLGFAGFRRWRQRA